MKRILIALTIATATLTGCAAKHHTHADLKPPASLDAMAEAYRYRAQLDVACRQSHNEARVKAGLPILGLDEEARCNITLTPVSRVGKDAVVPAGEGK